MTQEFTKLLAEYISYCDEIYDYNYPTPRLIGPYTGHYMVENIKAVKRREEPSLKGFLRWLKLRHS